MTIVLKSNSLATGNALRISQQMNLAQKSTLRLSSGERIITPYDDAGQLSQSAKIESHAKAERHLSQSMENSLSFLNTQRGYLDSISSILSEMSELRSAYDNPVYSGEELENYDKIFKQLRQELSDISKKQFNGVSLFSDQIPKVLFGDSVGLEKIIQRTDALDGDDNISLTRWGMYRNFSLNLDSDDRYPDKDKATHAKDFLAFTITDESSDTKDGRFRGYSNDLDKYEKDLESWTQWVSENNLDIKIATVVAQTRLARDGGPLLPSVLNEENDLPPFVNAYRGMLRESGGVDAYDEDKAVDFLKDAFWDMTNGGSELPRAVGFFVDNSGSLRFNQVNQAVFKFKEWIESNYGKSVGGSIATSSVSDAKFLTDPEGENAIAGAGQTGWVNGVWMAGYEDWIEQSRAAIEDLINSDDDIFDSINDGTLDDDKTGIKSLLDTFYSLSDFNQEEFLIFEERITSALAQNGAEVEAVNHSINNLQNSASHRMNATSVVGGTDYSTESTRFLRQKFLINGGSVLLNKYKNLTATALTILGT